MNEYDGFELAVGVGVNLADEQLISKTRIKIVNKLLSVELFDSGMFISLFFIEI